MFACACLLITGGGDAKICSGTLLHACYGTHVFFQGVKKGEGKKKETVRLGGGS